MRHAFNHAFFSITGGGKYLLKLIVESPAHGGAQGMEKQKPKNRVGNKLPILCRCSQVAVNEAAIRVSRKRTANDGGLFCILNQLPFVISLAR